MKENFKRSIYQTFNYMNTSIKAMEPFSNLSCHIKNKLSKLCKEFCKECFNIMLVFNSCKIKNYFSYKDPIPN